MDYHGLSWTVLDCLGLSWTVLDCLGLSGTVIDCHGLSWTTKGTYFYLLFMDRQTLVPLNKVAITTEHGYPLSCYCDQKYPLIGT